MFDWDNGRFRLLYIDKSRGQAKIGKKCNEKKVWPFCFYPLSYLMKRQPVHQNEIEMETEFSFIWDK